ncbi:MAG: UbiA family prenyltransferase [Nitrososphaerota archaeon]|nr:UbiA family prenyltransferase [Aigarchaeota archaeon]MDW8077015.1 UbiA family prenyltransferase [Nitrososphaerota archaeon]
MSRKLNLNKLVAYIKLTRPQNGIMMFIAVLVGVLFSEGRTITAYQAILAFVTAFSLNGSSMAINDYFDKDVDAINLPSRPIPSGIVSPKGAIIFSLILGALGLIAATFTSYVCLAFATVAYTSAILYNSFVKTTGLPGNMLVSFNVVAPFVYGSLMIDGTVGERVLIFALLAFLANTGREVIKGISDVEGDALRGVRSVARSIGEKKAAVLGAVLYVSAVCLSPLPYVLGYVSSLYIPIVLVCDSGFVYSSISIIKSPTKENAIKVKNQSLAWMFIALISFIVGGFT